MSRGKGRKGRQQPAQQRGNVYLRIEGGAGDGMRLKVPGFSAAQYRRVRELAQAGAIRDPLVGRFVRAVGMSIGHDVDTAPAPWTDVDTVELLRWLDMVPAEEWTGVDDAEVALLLGGAS
ncbi:hypothetical protein ACF1AB_16600 [Streptomyces sp. NPDC014846]|uniref:hypothetical protein n=1 Tax=Streptomyces sp. NPDC014846 TaxID=3364922 RepID=UPI0036FE72CF